MSVINKEPYINKILKLLTAEELETLQECVNGTGSTPVFKSLVANSPYLLTTSDYGIYPARLELALQKAGLAQNVLEGYLIYKENGEAEGTDLCALIAYAGVAQQFLELYIMHKENGVWKWENKTCNLTIIDLRSEMFDVAGGGSGGFSVRGHTLVLGRSEPEPEPEPLERIVFDLRGQVSLTNGNNAIIKDYDFSDLLTLVTWEDDVLSVNEPVPEIEILFDYGKDEYDLIITPDFEEPYQERTYWVAKSQGPSNYGELGNNIDAEFDFTILAGDTGFAENPTVGHVNLKIFDNNIL